MNNHKLLYRTVAVVILSLLITQVLMPVGDGSSKDRGYQPIAPSTDSSGSSKIASLGLMQNGVVDFSIIFNTKNSVKLENHITNSHEKSFGIQSALSKEQFEVDYSPAQSCYDHAFSYLEANNLSVTQTWANRLMITAQGSVADVEKAFATKIGLFADGNMTFYRNLNEISIPVPLRQCSVAGISLNSLPNTPYAVSAVNTDKSETASDGENALLYGTPSDFRDIYGVAGAFQSGWSGAGTTIAIVVAYGDPSIVNDLNNFNTYYGLPNTTLTIEGTQAINSDWNWETALDVEWAHAIAPDASILLKVAADNYDTNLYGAINSLINRANPPDIISCSWGRLEQSEGGDTALSSIFSAAAAKGIKVYVSSGDHGAFDNDGSFGVSYPASDPNVIAVGGTEVYYNTIQGTREYYEVGWNGSGGGYSTIFNEPTYQVNAGIPDPTGKRAVPDVSLTGGPASAVRVYCNNTAHYVSGTSLSCPMMAGIASIALNGQWNLDNTAMYRLYNSSSKYNVAFHDVYLSGNNGFYSVSQGWDAVTGLGSINFQNFVSIYGESTGVSLTGQYLASSSVLRGQSFPMSYLLSNPYSGYPLTQIGLGATIRIHGTTTNITDATNDIYTNLITGSSIKNRQFNTSSVLTVGSYDVLWDVWMGPPNYGNLLSSSGWQMNQLQVTSSSPTFDFSLAATPSSKTVNAGGSTTYAIASTLVGTSGQTVTLSCSNTISRVSFAFSPNSGSPPFDSTLTVQTSSTTPQGTYILIISGSDDGITHSTTVQLNVGDSYEPDNSFLQYSSLNVTTALQSQLRTIKPADDNDYIRFYAEPGTYTFYTASSIDTSGYLYDPDQNLLTHDDDSAGGLQFLITYQIVKSGYYFLRVNDFSKTESGPYTLYCHYTSDSAPLPPQQKSPIDGAVNAATAEVFSWSASKGASLYQLLVQGASPGIYNTYNTTSTMYPMSLNEGTYTWQLRAYNNSGWSQWTTPWSFILDITPPSTPNPDDDNSGWDTTGIPTFTWSASDGISGIAGYYWRVDSGPETWTTTSSVTLPAQTDGTHTFYVKAKDNAGNNGTYGSHTFQIDTTYPSGSITINQANQYTTSTFVTLTLTFFDQTSGIEGVRYSNDGYWDTENWESPASTKAWALLSGDGSKTVYYQIKDEAGLIQTYYASIILDTTAPSGSITINEGAAYATSTSATLSLTYADAVSGISQVRFSASDSWDNVQWESPSANRAWTLSGPDSVKTVYYQIKNNAGLVTTLSANTILDTTPPTGSITINNGTAYAISPNVNLTLSMTDTNSNSASMRFSNDNSSWSNWQSYATSQVWSLLNGDGNRTVYVQFRDDAGLISGYNASIVLDETTPTANAGSSQTVTVGNSVTVNGDGSSDNTSGIVSYLWDFGDGSTANGSTATHTYASAGTYTAELTVRDAAGNIAKATVTITVQARPSSSSSSSSSSSNTASSPSTLATVIPTPTPMPTPAPTPNTIPATTDNGANVTLTVEGNIAASQISKAAFHVDQAAGTTTLSFTVTGESGTSGSGTITIPKSQVPYGTTPLLYIDGVAAENQSYTQDAANYYVTYTVPFSTHEISVVFMGASTQPTGQDYTLLIVVAVLATVACAAGAVLLWRRHGKIQI